jgi:transcriptional regulator with XRE-family HTH domain
VSKSMLSQIEREKANPTIAITWRLANALGVQIGELLADGGAPRTPSASSTPTRRPPCPAIMPATCCASWARWNWPANTSGTS